MDPLHPDTHDYEFGVLLVVVMVVWGLTLYMFAGHVALNLKDALVALEGLVGFLVNWL